MKLLRYGPVGQEKPGLLDAGGVIRDLSALIPDIAGEALSPGALAKLAAVDTNTLPAVTGSPRIGPPVSGFSQLICIGLNYADHAAETGAAIPKEPIVFLKANGAICGPNDDVIIPKNSVKCDWEVELCIVIGTRASCVSEAQAFGHVAGYATGNDVSEREFQLERGGQWDKGKNCETFNPLGPAIVTRRDLPDPQRLALTSKVNGEVRQSSTTADMIFPVAQLVRYVSQFMTLYPGDIINTGTPQGVGSGFSPPRFLTDGDVVEVSIEAIGTQSQRFERFEREPSS